MKYMGSKARFAGEILPIILRGRVNGQWYVEPFAGGMNTICNVGGNRIANDINYFLIEMWREIIGGWIPDLVSRDEYYNVKKFPDKYPAYFVGWVGFNCSYSGKWFGGFAGSVKTKTGNIRDYQSEAIRNVLKQARKMQGVILVNKPYYELEIPPHSIIYCDPPYEGTTGYAAEFKHDLFWEWARDISEQGHTVYISEYKAPSDFRCIWQKKAKSSLSANGKSGGSKLSTEKLFVYGNAVPNSKHKIYHQELLPIAM